MIIKACVAGLYAVDDIKNATKIKVGVNLDDFVDAFTTECTACRGKGVASKSCSNCRGSGDCQNSKCENGRTTFVGISGREQTRKCSLCGGTGKCNKCKGAGHFSPTCSKCRGTKKITDKKQALAACQKILTELSQDPQMAYTLADGNSAESEPQTATPVKATSVKWDCSTNKSGMNKTFQDYKFDFTQYNKWRDRGSTDLQKDGIIRSLFIDGFESNLYKEYIRCYFALVPDGTPFVVKDVKEWGDDGYRVKLALSGNMNHTSQKQLLLSGRMDLMIPQHDDFVESLRKGTIILSEGWVYDVLVEDAVCTYTNGQKEKVRQIKDSGIIFRSMNERLIAESR